MTLPASVFSWKTIGINTSSLQNKRWGLSVLFLILVFNFSLIPGLLTGQPLNVTPGNSSVTCFGGNDGNVNITISGGTSPYQVNFNGGGFVEKSSPATYPGLTSGTYTWEVLDANAAAISGTESVTQPSDITAGANPDNPLCYGLNNGGFTITASGGTGTLQYSRDGGTNWQPSGVFTGLAGGTYNWAVIDNNGCQKSGSVTVTIPAVLISVATPDNPLCYGVNNGGFTLTASGGTGTLQYSRDGGATWQASGVFTGLAGGTYNWAVIDNNGCQKSGSVTVTIPAELISVATPDNPLCYGVNNGGFTLTASGGTGTLQYSRNGGATWQASGVFTGLAGGNYNWAVIDNNGCQKSGSVTVTIPADITAGANPDNPLCYGVNNGGFTITASGGSGALQYSRDGGATWQASGVFTGLAGGTYNWAVIDNNACQKSGSVTVTIPPDIIAGISATEIACNGGFSTVTITASGGTGVLTYIFNGVQQPGNGVFTGIPAGSSYSWSVKDASNCQKSGTLDITQPSPLTATETHVNVLCNGQSTGSITVDASGGNNPYTYALNGGSYQSPKTFNNLSAGNYLIRVKDKNGCLVDLSVTLTQTNPVAVTAWSNSVVCEGSVLNLTGGASGGTGPYQYSWTGPVSTYSGQNISIPNVNTGYNGNYTLTVTDANNCTANQTINVLVNDLPNVDISPTISTGFVKKNTGNTVYYLFTITNTGTVPDIFDLSSLNVPDPDTENMTARFFTLGNSPITFTPTIPAGSSYTFKLELMVQGNPTKVFNHTRITATSRLCSVSKVDADIYTYEYNSNKPPSPTNAQLEISKSAGVTNATEGTNFNYTLTVYNNSSSTNAEKVILSDQVPPSLTIVNAGGGNVSGNVITWNIGTLYRIGQGINTVQKVITVRPSCSSVPVVTNTALVTSWPLDNDLSDNSISLNTPVLDPVPPTAACKNSVVYLNAAGNASITAAMVNNGSSDNCGIQSLSVNPSSFTCAQLGNNPVILTVTDKSGNTATCTATVTVLDNIAPTFTSCPASPAPFCGGADGKFTQTGNGWNALATDNCGINSLTYQLSGATSGSGTTLNGIVFNPGVTTISWEAADASWNKTTCQFSVEIIDCNNLHYRTRQNGNWDNVTTWEASQFVNGPWSAAYTFPTSSVRTIRITNPNLVTVTSNISVDEVTVEAGGKVTVNSGASFNNVGSAVDFVIQSTPGTLNGSLIVNGTFLGNLRYDRALTPSQTYIISPPVNVASGFSANSAELLSGYGDYNFARYIEADNTGWDYYKTLPDNLTNGEGYIAKTKTTGILSFSGIVNSNISLVVYNGGDGRNGWNGAGNPYTSAIRIKGGDNTGFIWANKDILEPGYAGIYVWNGNQYKVIGNDGYTPPPWIYGNMGTLSDQYVQAGQGFLVNVKSSPVSFTPAMQLHATDITLKSASMSWPGLTLLSSFRGKLRSTIVTFNKNMTPGLDNSFDLGMIPADQYALYTQFPGGNPAIDLAIQSLPDNQYDQLVIPLGLDLPEGGEVYFKAVGVILPPDILPVIEDRLLKLNTPLAGENTSYTVVLPKNSMGSGRFFLRFGNLKTASEVKPTEVKYSAWYANRKIIISGPGLRNASVQLFDINGRKLGDYLLRGETREEIPAEGVAPGVYLLHIRGTGGNQVVKVPVASHN